MKKLYLIRHGSVDFPDGVKRCIGSTNLSLSQHGKNQAKNLQVFFENDRDIIIYSSPLQRALETAQIIANHRVAVRKIDDLQELNMGEWENRPLKSIEKTLISEPLDGEKREDGLKRIKSVIKKIITDKQDNNATIICVAHASLNSCLIADLLGVPLEISRSFPQAYGCMNELVIDGKELKVKKVGIMPKEYPDIDECKMILNHYKTPHHIQEHCQAVASKAVSIADKLNFKFHKKGQAYLDTKLLRAASALHDIARLKKNHAKEGAYILRREGYPKVARIIEQHHGLENPLLINEAALLFYADKIVQEDKTVSIEERFAKSWQNIQKKNPSRDTMDSFYRNMRQAYIIENNIANLLK